MAETLWGLGTKRKTTLEERREKRGRTPSLFLARVFQWPVTGATVLLFLAWTPALHLASLTLPSLNLGTQEKQLPDVDQSSPLSGKQKQDILKSNFEKMKHDADDLAALAKSLQEDLNKSNENVLSLKIVEKAEKIEKLAKKIKATARGD